MTSLGFDVLIGSPVFAGLPPAELAAIGARAIEARFVSPTLLAGRGERPASLWHVLDGGVEIGLYSEAGRSAQLAPILSGGWATWLACFQDAPLPHDLWTGPDTRLLAFPSAAVRDLAVRFPQIYPRLIDRIGERMRDLIGWALAAALSDPERRLAYLLAVTARGLVVDEDRPVVLTLTQDRIAAMGLGTRQRVARLLQALAARGLVRRGYGALTIPSLRRLEDFATL